jgi:hypothetical protein
LDLKDQKNPFSGISYVPYERQYVEFIDALIDFAKKNQSTSQIVSDADWKTMEFIYKGWKTFYPIHATQFEDHMKDVRNHSHIAGIVKEGEGMIQYQLEIPEKLYHMIQIIFPNQKWDREFIRKFAQHFPTLRAAERL